MLIPRFKALRSSLSEQVSIAPLAVFRILFGLMMFASTIRFFANGWIYDLYVRPVFFFKYFSFEWVQVPSENWLYVLFGIIALSALSLALGFAYRISAIVFFLTFSYSELMDQSNYLNHYYFVSIIALIMIFLPAGRYFAIDIYFRPEKKITHVPRAFIAIIQLQLALVYIFAGLAKLNYDWLFQAQPLKIWLQAHSDMPLIGSLLEKDWIAYVFSWFGALYDLTVVFFLLNVRTRGIAYFFVVLFHAMTSLLFPIGMFPYIMIVSTLIFFPAKFHFTVIEKIRKIIPGQRDHSEKRYSIKGVRRNFLIVFFSIHLLFQVLIPLRYLFYPGNLFWTEQGYRFSWRVMLMEKSGKAFFHVTDPDTKRSGEIMMSNYLTPYQEKMMATQPDMMLQYAHFLRKKYQEAGIKNPQITVESYVTLNGRGSQLFVNKYADLGTIPDSFGNKWWILPQENK